MELEIYRNFKSGYINTWWSPFRTKVQQKLRGHGLLTSTGWIFKLMSCTLTSMRTQSPCVVLKAANITVQCCCVSCHQ